MIVKGVEIPSSVIKAAETHILEGGCTYRDIAAVCVRGLRDAGLPTDVADRAADRLLQVHRKRGAIWYVAGKWRLRSDAEIIGGGA